LNNDSKFKIKVLQEAHDYPAAGHVGFFKTYYNARQSFFWKGMSTDIQKYVAECDLCQKNKTKNISIPGVLHPLHFLTKNGKKSQWILLKDYQYQKEKIKS
jgi:hypothetical protein